MRILFGLIILSLLSSFSFADTIRQTIPANKSSAVGLHGTYSPECESGVTPQIKVTKEPENGSVSFQQINTKLGEKAGRCAGRPVKGTVVVYKPNRGFRGKDVFRIRFTMDMYDYGSAKIRNVAHKYVIEVK